MKIRLNESFYNDETEMYPGDSDYMGNYDRSKQLTLEERDALWDVVDNYMGIGPHCLGQGYELYLECRDIADALDISFEEAKGIMIRELGFGEEDFGEDFYRWKGHSRSERWYDPNKNYF